MTTILPSDRAFVAGVAARALADALMREAETIILPQYRATAINAALDAIEPGLSHAVSKDMRRRETAGEDASTAMQRAITNALTRILEERRKFAAQSGLSGTYAPAYAYPYGTLDPEIGLGAVNVSGSFNLSNLAQMARDAGVPVDTIQEYAGTAAGLLQTGASIIGDVRGAAQAGQIAAAGRQAGEAGRAVAVAQAKPTTRPAQPAEPLVWKPRTLLPGQVVAHTAQQRLSRVPVEPQPLLSALPWWLWAGGLTAIGYVLLGKGKKGFLKNPLRKSRKRRRR